jgi:hypothetical protein
MREGVMLIMLGSVICTMTPLSDSTTPSVSL